MTTRLPKLSTFLSACVLSCATIAGSIFAQESVADEPRSSAAIHDVAVPSTSAIFGTFNLDRLGGEKVAIWNDVNDGRRYYYLPSLLPEWQGFRESIVQQCASTSSDTPIEVDLRILLSDSFYEDEIREKIAEFTDRETIQEYVLSAIPYDNIQILLRENSALPAKLLHDSRGRSRSLSDDNAEVVPLLSYPRDVETTISGPCDTLMSFADLALAGVDVLDGRIYFQGVAYRTTSFHVQLSKFFDSRKSLDLFGDETLVSRMTFTNTHGFQEDNVGDKLMMRLPRVSATGSAVRARQRLLSRDYVSYISMESFSTIIGGCAEAETDSEMCGKLSERFLEFILQHAETVELTFREQQSGSFALSDGQVDYATISPQQFKAIARAAPTFEGDIDGEKVKTSDNISWELVAAEPVPTKVELVLLDEQSLRDMADVYWYHRTPVRDTTRQLVANLDYFALRFGDNRILAFEEYAKLKRLEFACQSGGNIVHLTRENVIKGRGRISEGFRAITHKDRAHKCSISFGRGWKSKKDHFFLVKLGESALSIPQRWAAGGWSFDKEVEAHELDVPRENGSAQMVRKVRYWGSAERGYKMFGRLTCGAKVRFHLQQYPEYCAPFVVQGYSEVRETQGVGSVK